MPGRPSSNSRDSGDLPLVSVVLPTYRESIAVLERALDSVLNQTYSNLEVVVVVDDPSDPVKLEFLKARVEADHRMRVIQNVVNIGPWASYNRGVGEARGSLIAIQDSDDVSSPGRIQALTEFLLANPHVGVVGSAIEYIDEASGRVLLTRVLPANAGSAIGRYCPIAHPTTVRWARLFVDHGGYDEASVYRHAADYELWCRWHLAGVKMVNVPTVLYHYYQSAGNFKTQNVKPILRDTVRIKRRYSRRLRFGIVDYLLLATEVLASALPDRAIVWAFYVANRRRSRRGV